MLLSGIGASKGYAIGNVVLRVAEEVEIPEHKAVNISEELEIFNKALEKSKEQLKNMENKAISEIGEAEGAVFGAHLMMLSDPELINSINQGINSGLNAVKSTFESSDKFIKIFESMDNEYFRERAADIRDVSGRLILNLLGKNVDMGCCEENSIIVAHDLSPSDTAQLDRTKVIGFLTDIGGRTSHSAIMARTLEIPAVVGMKNVTAELKNGDTVIVDGFEGVVIVNPDEKVLEEYQNKKIEYTRELNGLKEVVGYETRTSKGKRIYVAGNIGNPKDIDKVMENGGDGVGLFRTEFLFMDRNEAPSEEEQYESYKYVLEKALGNTVVIRTLDIGGDKVIPYLNMPEEMNPFLGYRAIRLCLDRKDIFKPQIRALLRASVHGKLAVMFPMISGLDEIMSAMDVVKECKAELDSGGYKYSEDIEWGIMVEIPAAAVCAEELAQHVDFFSIGTNDLIQYTLACDRMSEKVSYLYEPMHPAVLRLIKMTIDGAHKHGKWVGMCGEMAGDEEAIPTLLEYGLDEFSMSASSILTAKKLISSL